jgi:hypothetical protein
VAEHEPDGVKAATRVAITAGGLLSERMMRAREQAMRDAQAHREQHARELHERMNSERAVARQSLARVGRDERWERTGCEEIGVAWETANAWRDVDRDAAHTVEQMRDQLRGRYGIDPDSLDADPGAVQDALEPRDRAADGARAAALYDSADARRDAAADLDGVVAEETIVARVIADTSQARPVEDAVTSGPSRPPAARRSRGNGSQTRSPARRPDRGRQPCAGAPLVRRALCASARRRVGFGAAHGQATPADGFLLTSVRQ